jgi:hypothetical protein
VIFKIITVPCRLKRKGFLAGTMRKEKERKVSKK